MADPLRELEDLARAAEEHARREHGAAGLDLETADRVLRSERDPARVETLAACYGAWLGRLWGGRWIGLHEPVPPRLRVGTAVVSPIDAVRRRLRDPGAPSLAELTRRIEEWAKPPPSDANLAAWDGLAADPRFTGAVEGPPDPWLGEVRGKDVLCLAAGGGRHGPLLARAGARVTVVDFSERQLEHDRKAGIRAVRASIDDLSPLAGDAFDVVVQPVSACYVRDVGRVHAEVARVLRPGGQYLVQHRQPGGACDREPGMTEYRHSLEDLLGGLCRAGFVIEDVQEPPRGDALAPEGSSEHRAWLQPPYLKVKARRLSKK
jgi:SAM-dependent methyltransferase